MKLFNYPKKRRDSDSSTFRRRFLKRKYTRIVFNYLTVIFLITILGYVAYISIKYVVNLRESKHSAGSDEYIKGYVLGFSAIPEYPGSEFIFSDSMDDSHVREFLSKGNSVYRLPPNTTFDKVSDFYIKELKKTDWEHVLSVPLESEERKYGEYWVMDSKAIRIYSRLDDIWYESVSVKEAKSGLEDTVKAETELKLLLLTTESYDLLPDFPWILKIPSDYLVSYGGTDIGEFQSVKIKKIGSNRAITIEPLGYVGAFSYDSFLENYLKNLNSREKTDWRILNTSVTTVGNLESIVAVITDDGLNAEAYVVGNPRNDVVYIFRSTIDNDPFLKYIVDRIEPAKSSY